MNSRFANILLSIFVGIVIALLLCFKPWLGLGSIVAVGLLYARICASVWRRRSPQKDVELLTQASSHTVDPLHTYYQRGQTRLASQDFDGAIADFNRVIDIDINFGAAYYYRALALIAIEEVAEALIDLQSAADIASQNQDESLIRDIERTHKALTQSSTTNLSWLQQTAVDLN